MESGDEMTEEVWYDCCTSSNVVLIVDDPSNGSLMKTRAKSEAHLSSENCGDSEKNSSYRTLHGRKDGQLPSPSPSPIPGCSKWLHGHQQLKRKSNENVSLCESLRPSSSVKINNCNNNCRDVVLSTSKFPAKGLSNIPVSTTNRSCYKRGYSRSPTPTKREENSKLISDSVKWNSQSSLNRYKKIEDPCSDSDTLSTNKMNSIGTESEQKSEKASIKECETKNLTISQKEQVCSLKIIPTTLENSENSNSATIADSKIRENEPPTPQDDSVELNGKTALNQTDIWQNIVVKTDPHNAQAPIKCRISPVDNNPKCFKSTFRNALSKCSRRLLPVKAPPEHLNAIAAAAPNQMSDSDNFKTEMKSIPTTLDKACNTRVTGVTPKSTILDCSICFDTLLYENTNAESGTKDIKTVVATSCGHIFHEECIKAWLNNQRKKRCPICCSRCCSENLLTIFIDSGSRNGSEASNESAENKDIHEIHSTLIEDYEELQLKFDELKTEHEFCSWKTVVIQSLQSAYDLESSRRMELEKENEILHQKIHSMKMDVFVAQSRLIKPL